MVAVSALGVAAGSEAGVVATDGFAITAGATGAGAGAIAGAGADV